MFILTELQDVVRVDPWCFGKDMNEVITSTLNNKLANKVMHNVGLCISLYDIAHVGDSYVFPSDGASHTKVKFRFIVFRPFIDEILVGKIRSSSPEGIRVSLGFFDDIHIPKQSLQHPSKFDREEQIWVWEYETDEGKHDMFMDEGEQIRFRVVEEAFVDISPFSVQHHTGESSTTVPVPASSTTVLDGSSHNSKQQQAPYTITGSISESGLGLINWWTG